MDDPPRARVPAIDRAVAVLDLVADCGTEIGCSDIARRLGLPKSSVHGICETMVALGLLRAEGAGYRPGARPLRWSSAYLGQSSLVAGFRHLLARETRLSGLSVTLSALEGCEVTYLACHNGDRPLGITFRIGMRLPAVYTATGKAMLAALPEAEMLALLAHPWQPPFTAASVPDARAFASQADEWRRLGYAVDEGEVREGMVCLGAAILDDVARPVAGIALSMTSAEARPAERARLGAVVREIAATLSGR